MVTAQAGAEEPGGRRGVYPSNIEIGALPHHIPQSGCYVMGLWITKQDQVEMIILDGVAVDSLDTRCHK